MPDLQAQLAFVTAWCSQLRPLRVLGKNHPSQSLVIGAVPRDVAEGAQDHPLDSMGRGPFLGCGHELRPPMPRPGCGRMHTRLLPVGPGTNQIHTNEPDHAMGIKYSLWKTPRRLTPLREVTRTPQNKIMRLPAVTGVPGRY